MTQTELVPIDHGTKHQVLVDLRAKLSVEAMRQHPDMKVVNSLYDSLIHHYLVGWYDLSEEDQERAYMLWCQANHRDRYHQSDSTTDCGIKTCRTLP